jgi:dephospho-CoA kinase
VAAGKSEALAAFGRLGAATISSDAIVHDLLDGEPLLGRLVERWGEDISSGGVVDRAAVGSRVFNDPDELAWLERQVHPLVQGEIGAWVSRLDPETEFAVIEVPLLFEGEMADRFDLTVAITAREETRRERARSRGQVGIEGREGRQLTQSEKAGRADRVIENDGTREELEARLEGLLGELRAGLTTDGHG